VAQRRSRRVRMKYKLEMVRLESVDGGPILVRRHPGDPDAFPIPNGTVAKCSLNGLFDLPIKSIPAGYYEGWIKADQVRRIAIPAAQRRRTANI
jgi:hypothetical protein